MSVSIRKLAISGLTVAVLVAPASGVPAMAAPAESRDAVEAQAAGGADGADRATGAARSAAAYRVGAGSTFNNPRRKDQSGRIINKIKRSINHTPRGQKIWVMTWNFQAPGITRDLVRAHRRGVGVRLIMARSLAQKQGYNGSFKRLTRALKKGNGGRPGHLKSFTRTCSNSCRGRGGSMHSKFMLISRSGQSHHVVQQGSANFTTTAGGNQWNDWYALPNNKPVYETYQKVFLQALKDRPAGSVSRMWRNVNSWFAPRSGDMVMSLLKGVRCKGARGAGINGKTAIRVASSVFQNERGLRIARKLKSLQRGGCNIRVVFTMMTNKIRGAIRGVPTRQLVYDWNGDGAFDRYLHMKAMTISGNFRGDRNHRLVFNGSANWSTMGQVSDEQGMVIHSRGQEKRYGRWINGLYNSAPRGLRPTPEQYVARGLKNPYADLELELAHQG
jgi:phosphatidylserine/phosphatidylglycerophosphate/cardiolipin synthase-like enzyme